MIKDKYSRQRYEERKASNLCVLCGKPLDREDVVCTACNSKRTAYGRELYKKLQAVGVCPSCSICWNCNIPPRECKYINDVLKKLADYEDLEEQDRLVILPCKYVYYIVDINNPKYAMVMKRPIKELAIYEIEDIDKENCKYFSTEEKAEARLKELRGGE